MRAQRSSAISFVTIFLALAVSTTAKATVIYDSRATFNTAIGTSITDAYSVADYGPNITIRNNVEMNAVLGETQYTPTGFSQLNIVGVESFNLSRAYCAGCNGSFYPLQKFIQSEDSTRHPGVANPKIAVLSWYGAAWLSDS